MSKKSPQEPSPAEGHGELPHNDERLPDLKAPAKQDHETLTMLRIQRLLLKLPDDGTRGRVIAYLYDRHVTSKERCKVQP
jgi:hypothetical protein